MKKRALKAGMKVFFVSEEVGLYTAVIKEVEYDLDEDGKKHKDRIVVKIVLEERTYAFGK